MHTYVINTSENKNFDSNLLFELAHYEQIRWKSCSLTDIRRCAEEICQEEDTRIPFREFRVVVLVDLFQYEIKSKDTVIPVSTESDYMEIYKFFLEHYLLSNLFEYLKKNHVPARFCEIYYIQYAPHTPISRNEREMEQIAMLFGCFEEAECLRKRRESLQSESCAEEIGLFDKELLRLAEGTQAQGEYAALSTKHRGFTLHCTQDVELPFSLPDADGATPGTESTFLSFYLSYRIDHRSDVRKFPIVIHEPYVTHGENTIRAAYDTLALSLYLVYAYERTGDGPIPNFRLPKPERLEEILIKAYQKVHSARVESQKSDIKFYYKLENNEPDTSDEIFHASVKQTSDEKSGDGVDDIEIARSRYRLPQETRNRHKLLLNQYDHIVNMYELQKSGAAEKEIDRIFDAYLTNRDKLKDIDPELPEENESACPSELRKNRLIDRCNRELSSRLGDALRARYLAQDFSAQKQRATQIRERYLVLCDMKGTALCHLVLLALILSTMLGTYVGMQYGTSGFSPISVVIAALGITGVFLAALFLRWIPIRREMDTLRDQMHEVHEDCLATRYRAVKELAKCYESDLPEIEKIRYDIRRIERLYAKNQEKYRQIENHRDTLELVEDVLIGILNCFRFSPADIKTIDTPDFFDIKKPLGDSANSVYRVLSIDTIDEIFRT